MSLINTQPSRLMEKLTQMMIHGYLRRNEVDSAKALELASAGAAQLHLPQAVEAKAQGRIQKPLQGPGALVFKPVGPSDCLG